MDPTAVASSRSGFVDLVYCKISFIDFLGADMRLIKNRRSPTPSSFRLYDTFLGLGGRDCQNCHSYGRPTKGGVASMPVICLKSTDLWS
jgi:hypothetical protein